MAASLSLQGSVAHTAVFQLKSRDSYPSTAQISLGADRRLNTLQHERNRSLSGTYLQLVSARTVVLPHQKVTAHWGDQNGRTIIDNLHSVYGSHSYVFSLYPPTIQKAYNADGVTGTMCQNSSSSHGVRHDRAGPLKCTSSSKNDSAGEVPLYLHFATRLLRDDNSGK